MKQRLAMAVQQSAGRSANFTKQSEPSDAHDSLMDDLLALPPPQHSRYSQSFANFAQASKTICGHVILALPDRLC